MKYDFSKPLTEEQMQVVRHCQNGNDEVVITADELGLSPDDVFAWTIQDYETRRQELWQQSKAEMTPELMHEINQIYSHQVTLRKCYEDWQKEQIEKKQAKKQR